MLTVTLAPIFLVRIHVCSCKKVQVCDNFYILQLRPAILLNMFQVFPTVPTKIEIAQAATA